MCAYPHPLRVVLHNYNPPTSLQPPHRPASTRLHTLYSSIQPFSETIPHTPSHVAHTTPSATPLKNSVTLPYRVGTGYVPISPMQPWDFSSTCSHVVAWIARSTRRHPHIHPPSSSNKHTTITILIVDTNTTTHTPTHTTPLHPSRSSTIHAQLTEHQPPSPALHPLPHQSSAASEGAEQGELAESSRAGWESGSRR